MTRTLVVYESSTKDFRIRKNQVQILDHPLFNLKLFIPKSQLPHR